MEVVSNLAKYINMEKLIKELEKYKLFNKTIDIDFVIVLIKLYLKNEL